MPDFRDFPYEPLLVPLREEIPAPKNLIILNQGQEGACTGFGLAAVINLLLVNRGERILGMQAFRKYLRNLPGSPVFRFEISDGTVTRKTRTASETHGGFDNDVSTMNDILRSVLKEKPSREFTLKDLDY